MSNRAWLVAVCVLVAPAGIAGHGVALPITKVAEEVYQASMHAQALVKSVFEECSGELEDNCSLMTRWEDQAKCLIGKVDVLKSESCRKKVENAGRHLPAAFYNQRANVSQNKLRDFGHRTNRGCNVSSDVLPYIWSYHVHIQWDYGCKECYETAMNWTDKFVKQFQPDAQMCNRMSFLTDLWNKKSVSAEHIDDHPFADMCIMSTMPPGGPFFHAEKGFVLSTTMFHKAIPWMMANRPLNDKLYIFVHPNSGCQYNDLRHWSMWIGNSIANFYDILAGCVWASCEDEVLGCIAFNHLGKNQGYGTCYEPPTAYGKPGMSLDCKMTIEPTSNTTTETCSKPNSTVTVPAKPTIPKTMMAGALTKRNIAGTLRFWNRSVPFDDIKYIQMEVPKVEKDQVLIKVVAGSIDPCEWKFPMGMESPLDWLPSYPLVLGRDCLGTVVDVGSDVHRLKIGDLVWANQGPFKQGCSSEYAAFKEQIASTAPSKLPAVEAATMPLVSLTALDALRFTGAPWPSNNKTVLILGGSGGVGHVAIQMAKAWGGSKVITTCGTSHVDFCSSVGADMVIDYHKQDWHEVLKPSSVDAVLDMVGQPGTGDQSYDVLRENGYFVALVPFSMPSMSAKAKRPDIKYLFSNTVYWEHKDLDIVRDLVDAGKLKPHIDTTYTWKELVPAFKYLMKGHETGKISIVPPNGTSDSVSSSPSFVV
mmetsp:Transcript_21459/g.37603  ORF Transcript_21459/g.37603 Transcript_21459/m.37603 type:complete len:703 (+) Transcript_21459:76-2184(+)